MNHVVEGVIMTGEGTGQTVLIPRIPIVNSSADMPIPFRRRQFPLRVCFSFSINKSQGQTLKCVGLDLEEPVFGHGQLYVGGSRSGAAKGVFYYAPNGRTRNIVARKALQ